MVRFETPEIFWLILPLAALLWFGVKRSYADLSRPRERALLLIRAVGFLSLLLAMSKPVLELENDDEVAIVCVDVSESVDDAALEKALVEIVTASQDLARDEKLGIVLFAEHPRFVRLPSSEKVIRDPALERAVFHRRERDKLKARRTELERSALGESEKVELAKLEVELQGIESWRTELGSGETDIEAATRLARGALPVEARRRVVLFTDGVGTRGDAEREVAELKKANVSVVAVPLVAEKKPEVFCDELRMPSEAQIQAPFTGELSVIASGPTQAEVKFFRDRFLIGSKQVELRAGPNILEVPRIQLDEGFHEFEARITAVADTVLENNVARAVVRVTGKPRVLLIERDPASARYLEEALTQEQIQIEVRPANGLPSDLNDLLGYDVLILSDVPADAFGPGAMDLVKSYVREMGGGLIMLGGDRSFGLGGYYRTPIEDALPVKMPIKKNVEKPNLAIVLVIDRSGSMTGTKIELAKEAAIASAEVLKAEDRFGVVAFDSLSQWICPVTSAAEKDSIVNLIARLSPGGGTNAYPALHDGWQALSEEDAKLKHMILLSDGQTTGSGYDALVNHIAADGITLSTVGIGEGADAKLLGDMASWGGGEYYFTDDPSQIPQILTRETMRASKSMLVEEPFVPRVITNDPVLKGVDMENTPFLLGYVATQAKETATVILSSEYNDPVLAVWGYGLGRAAAFTSDAKARWAGDWIGWEAFPKFWAQLVRSVMATGTQKELRTTSRVQIENGYADLLLDVRDRTGAFRDDVDLLVNRLLDRGESQSLTVTHEGPGLFRARVPLEEYGTLERLMIVESKGDEILGMKALGITASYSREFRGGEPNNAFLKDLATTTGGSFQAGPAEFLRFEGEPGRTPHATWWWWLVLAAILLPFDIGIRRFGF